MKIVDCHTHAVDENIYNQLKKKKLLDAFVGIRCDTYVMEDESFYEMACKDPNYYVLEKINVYEGIEYHFERIKKLYKKYPKKIIGIKLYPGYDPIYPDDERLYPIYDFALENNLVIVYHNGMVADDEHMSSLKYAHPLYVDDIAIKYPKLKFVISHLGFPHMMDAAMVVEKNENVYTDFSGIILTDGNSTKQLIEDLKRILIYFPILVEKMMFGTDYFGDETDYNNLEHYIELVESLFNEEDKKKIYYENFYKIYDIKR